MAVLRIKEGFNQGATFRLGQRTLTLGRDPGNLVQVIDDKASRRHALVRWTGSGYHLQDLNSHNGVYVNQARVAEADLAIGDLVRVGGTVFEVVTDDQCARDEVLGRKVVDRGIVAGETRTVSSQFSVQREIDQGQTVDVDQAVEQRSLHAGIFLYELARAVEARAPIKECCDKALAGLGVQLAPDRSFVFQLTPDGKAAPVSSGFAAGLAPERKRLRPYIKAISVAVERRKPLLLNQVPASGEPGVPIASAAAVPILRKADGRVTGVLYLDSFADNHQAYIEEDLEFMQSVVDALALAFG
jgi:predicted component of type VI protein secretion system